MNVRTGNLLEQTCSANSSNLNLKTLKLEVDEEALRKNNLGERQIGSHSSFDGVVATEGGITCNDLNVKCAEPAPGDVGGDSWESGNSVEKGREGIAYISDDPKENSDNFNTGWSKWKSILKCGDKARFIRERWGNTTTASDPSVDLTYRHRNNPLKNIRRNVQAGMKKWKNKREDMKKACVEHVKKLIQDIRRKHESDLSSFFEGQSLQLSSLFQRHYFELYNMAAGNTHCTMEYLLEEQKKEKQDLLMYFSNCVNELTQKTTKSVAQYEKCMDEMLMFQEHYEKDGNCNFIEEQLMHLRDTERMYDEYKRFYA